MARVSVCIPCFNYARFLPECVESVLDQDLPEIEILLADNASTDATPELVAAYAARDPRVRAFHHEANLGYPGNVNFLFSQARGELVTLLGCDDRYLASAALRTAADMLEQHAEASYFYSAFAEAGADGAVLREARYYDEAFCRAGHEELRHYLALRGVWISSVVARRADVRAIGGFDRDHEFAWDFGFFSRLALRGDACYSPRALVTRRKHEASLAAVEDEVVKLGHYDHLLAGLRDELGGDPELEAIVDATRASIALQRARGLREAREGGTRRPLHERPEWEGHLLRWRERASRVVIYGAGLHTRELLDTTNLASVSPCAVVDRDERLAGQVLEGLAVRPASELGLLAPDVVVISSKRYEDEIHAALSQSLPSTTELVRLYAA